MLLYRAKFVQHVTCVYHLYNIVYTVFIGTLHVQYVIRCLYMCLVRFMFYNVLLVYVVSLTLSDDQHGAFLDSMKSNGSSVNTPLDILSNQVSTLHEQYMTTTAHSSYTEHHGSCHHPHYESKLPLNSSSPPILETLLLLLKTTMDFVELTVRSTEHY